MSEKEKDILYDLARKLPAMTEHERGYLEGTLATAAAPTILSTFRRSGTSAATRVIVSNC